MKDKELHRRDFLRVILAGFGAYLASCKPRVYDDPLPPVLTTRTFTPAPSSTLTPSPTDTRTPFPTGTNTHTPAPTHSPTPTGTPTPTHIPTYQYVFGPSTPTMFGKIGWRIWSSQKAVGGKIEIVEDPVFGKVMKHIVTDNMVMENKQQICRIYRGFRGSGIEGDKLPVTMTWSVYFSETYAAGSDGWIDYGGLSVGGAYCSLRSSGGVLFKSKKYHPTSDRGITLQPNTWYKLAMRIGPDRKIEYYIDDHLEAVFEVEPPRELQVVSGHAGVYGMNIGKNLDISAGRCYILNSNIILTG